MKIQCKSLQVIIFFMIAIIPGLPAIASAGKASQGDMLPSFSLPEIVGERIINSDDYKGKVLLVDIWASWCGPCRLSFPFYNELYLELKDKGFEIIGINQDSELEKAKRFAETMDPKPEFTLVADSQKKYASGMESANEKTRISNFNLFIFPVPAGTPLL